MTMSQHKNKVPYVDYSSSWSVYIRATKVQRLIWLDSLHHLNVIEPGCKSLEYLNREIGALAPKF